MLPEPSSPKSERRQFTIRGNPAADTMAPGQAATGALVVHAPVTAEKRMDAALGSDGWPFPALLNAEGRRHALPTHFGLGQISQPFFYCLRGNHQLNPQSHNRNRIPLHTKSVKPTRRTAKPPATTCHSFPRKVSLHQGTDSKKSLSPHCGHFVTPAGREAPQLLHTHCFSLDSFPMSTSPPHPVPAIWTPLSQLLAKPLADRAASGSLNHPVCRLTYAPTYHRSLNAKPQIR